MPYWRLFYHIVWTTKGRMPFLQPSIEQALYPVLIGKCNDLRACEALAINGMPDHVHMIASVPPAMSLASFVKHLKGTSSRFIRTSMDVRFEWQTGYSVFSISERNLKPAVLYVRNQKEHHAAGSLIPRLEYVTVDDQGPPNPFPDPTAGDSDAV